MSPVPEPSGPRRPAPRVPALIAAAVALAVAMAVGLAACDRATPGSTASGEHGTSELGAAPSGSDGGAASPGSSPNTGPTAFASGPAADLHASYQVSRGRLDTNATVTVTITNEGTADSDGWTVAVALSGLDLVVHPGPGVNHETRGGQHIFTPAGVGGAISPGGLLTFTFGVTGVNVGVQSCMIDQKACTAA